MARYTELRPKRGKDGELKGGSVFRITVEPLDHRGRRIVVGLERGDILSFREERCSRKYTLPIRWAMLQAIRRDVEQKAREKAKERKARRIR